jgi:hypothetical protein
MDFSGALKRMKNGEAVFRNNWQHAKGCFITSVKPDDSSIPSAPFLCLFTPAGNSVPWTPNHVDLFATDWELRESIVTQM